MTERLAFGFGNSGNQSEAPAAASGLGASSDIASDGDADPQEAPPGRRREQQDWAYTGLMAFTALLFFRPQTEFPVLRLIPLAEIAALVGLGAMLMGRLGRGLTVTRFTPELLGVVALGGVILITAPFSIWMGGAVATFTDMYSKVILIFVLMINTLTSPKRIERFTWLILLASTYIAFRAVFDYARGINLIENGRVQGAVGGMFKNPNDLALNLVAVLPLVFALALKGGALLRRMFLIACGGIMIGAIIASHSRSGTVGLVMMVMFFAVYLVRRKPALVFAGALMLMLAAPLAPESYWTRLSSITDESQDDTGSRQARSILLREGWEAFLANPVTGVGAGQFVNYAPEGRVEAWRETHNVLLQVASELGVVGLLVFGFLIARAGIAVRQTRRLLRRATGRTGKRGPAGVPPWRAEGASAKVGLITKEDAEYLELHAAAMGAALAGWFFCALFASVAYNWTFYYLLALATTPREWLVDRLAATVPQRRSRMAVAVGVQEARA